MTVQEPSYRTKCWQLVKDRDILRIVHLEVMNKLTAEWRRAVEVDKPMRSYQ